MKAYSFYKNDLGWFIDLWWWPLSKGHLAMVAGADQLLDTLSGQKDKVSLYVSTKIIPDYDEELTKNIGLGLFNGALYKPRYEKILFDDLYGFLWLCFVTLFIFGEYPNKIYIKIKKT